ncbi:MAG: nucleoside triphosphate pyrophosphohydrolase [Gemmataceae bacterium]
MKDTPLANAPNNVPLDNAAALFHRFVEIVKALRTPGSGCPWDLEQDHVSLRPFLVEEAHEVLDAIDDRDDPHLCEELGDLLLQIVLHAQVAADRAAFSISDVVSAISDKMVRRHPHVFGGVQVTGAAEVIRNWEVIKAAEKRAKGRATEPSGLPRSLPALLRAQRLDEKKANTCGETADTGDLLREARARFRLLGDAMAGGAPPEALDKPLGDVLFALCRLANRFALNAEEALRRSSG